MTQEAISEMLKQLTDMEPDLWCDERGKSFYVMAARKRDMEGLVPLVICYAGSYWWFRFRIGHTEASDFTMHQLDMKWAEQHDWYLGQFGAESARNIRRSMQCD